MEMKGPREVPARRISDGDEVRKFAIMNNWERGLQTRNEDLSRLREIMSGELSSAKDMVDSVNPKLSDFEKRVDDFSNNINEFELKAGAFSEEWNDDVKEWRNSVEKWNKRIQKREKNFDKFNRNIDEWNESLTQMEQPSWENETLSQNEERFNSNKDIISIIYRELHKRCNYAKSVDINLGGEISKLEAYKEKMYNFTKDDARFETLKSSLEQGMNS
jgi:chromosome segregation ATPase